MRKGFVLSLIGIALLFALAIALSGCVENPPVPPNSILISVNGTSFEKGEEINFSIANNSSQSVFLPGCNAFYVEKFSQHQNTFSEGRWFIVDELLLRCFWEGIAGEIKAGEVWDVKIDSIHANSLYAGIKYRISVAGGIGCTPGEALSHANCSSEFTAKSAEFSIKATEDQIKGCQSNYECMLVDEGCCSCNYGGKRTSINKTFLQEYNENLSSACALAGVCATVISDDLSCNSDAVPVCNAGKCDLEFGNAITVYYRGKQCEPLPWAVLCEQGCQVPDDIELIKDYYKDNYGIEILDVSIGTYIVCDACDVCPSSEEFAAVVYEKDKQQMLSLGWSQVQSNSFIE